MENNGFTSQVATTLEQSKELVKLGIDPRCADMTHRWRNVFDSYELENTPYYMILNVRENLNKKTIMNLTGDDLWGKDVPAWSLHMLLKMAFPKGMGLIPIEHAYSHIIGIIEKRVKNDIFDKQYLKIENE